MVMVEILAVEINDHVMFYHDTHDKILSVLKLLCMHVLLL